MNGLRPWRRFWARYFDFMVHATVFTIIWTMIDESSFDKVNENVTGFLFLVAWIVLDGAYMYGFGTTPGKRIMGINVLNPDGSRIAKSAAFKRSRLVWLRGMGLGIGIFELIANIVGYSRLKREGRTSWDKDLDLIVKHGQIGAIRACVCPVVVVGIVALAIYGAV